MRATLLLHRVPVASRRSVLPAPTGVGSSARPRSSPEVEGFIGGAEHSDQQLPERAASAVCSRPPGLAVGLLTSRGVGASFAATFGARQSAPWIVSCSSTWCRRGSSWSPAPAVQPAASCRSPKRSPLEVPSCVLLGDQPVASLNCCHAVLPFLRDARWLSRRLLHGAVRRLVVQLKLPCVFRLRR